MSGKAHMTVVEFPSKPELAYWRCDCGCLTFYVRDDEELVCAICEKLSSNGFWKIPEGEKREEREGDLPTRHRETSDESFERTLRFINPDATALIAVVLKNGKVTVWDHGVFETRAQRGWLRRKLEVVRKILVDAS